MKVVVSYINSIYPPNETIKKIDACPLADGIHVDLMDGLYVSDCNFNIASLPEALKSVGKPLDIHLMTLNPSKYFPVLFKLLPKCIYIHPETAENVQEILKLLENAKIESGIVINPSESIEDFVPYFPLIKRVLLMSVIPGKGGQSFLEETPNRLEILKSYQEKYGFSIYIDGGINDETIKSVQGATGVVAGSFICLSADFNAQIAKLKN